MGAHPLEYHILKGFDIEKSSRNVLLSNLMKPKSMSWMRSWEKFNIFISQRRSPILNE